MTYESLSRQVTRQDASEELSGNEVAAKGLVFVGEIMHPSRPRTRSACSPGARRTGPPHSSPQALKLGPRRPQIALPENVDALAVDLKELVSTKARTKSG